MRLQAISPSAELLALQRAAYEVEARLIGDDRIPPLQEDLPALVAAQLSWLGALDGEQLLGAAAWTQTDDLVDVHRLVVAPQHHRRGVGAALVTELVRIAGSRRTLVATARQNAPARTLYEALGFTRLADVEVLPRLWVTQYAHGPGA